MTIWRQHWKKKIPTCKMDDGRQSYTQKTSTQEACGYSRVIVWSDIELLLQSSINTACIPTNRKFFPKLWLIAIYLLQLFPNQMLETKYGLYYQVSSHHKKLILWVTVTLKKISALSLVFVFIWVVSYELLNKIKVKTSSYSLVEPEESTSQSLSLNGHTLGFYTPTQKLEPPCAV